MVFLMFGIKLSTRKVALVIKPIIQIPSTIRIVAIGPATLALLPKLLL